VKDSGGKAIQGTMIVPFRQFQQHTIAADKYFHCIFS